MADERSPIIVGAGQFCPARFDPERIRAPCELAALAAAAAIEDCRAAAPVGSTIDAVMFVRLFSDSAPSLRSPFGGSTKPPVSVARRLALRPRLSVYSEVGGNNPQKLINEAAGAISRGELRAALVCGAEALRTTAEALRAGMQPDWSEDPPGDWLDRGMGSPLSSPIERRHGLGPPINTYPLFEHAIRGVRRATVAQHLVSMGRLFERMLRVAAGNPNAQFASSRSAEELATVSAENRWIGHPYPKWLVAQDRVDQAAAVIVTSAGAARAAGIDPTRWVYLHGCADIDDKPTVLDRIDYARSPAIEAATRAACDMAGVGVDRIAMFDLYSCFPSAVELACQALGVAEDDARDLTVTGGLPFFGGPGNNYSLHAIAELCARLRSGRGGFGMILANGGHLTKESCGIYSSAAPQSAWQGDCSAPHQEAIRQLRGPPATDAPEGRAVVETYTVVHAAGVPERGIVIGRLGGGALEAGDRHRARFIANTPPGRPDILRWMVDREPLGAPGRVSSLDGANTFIPDGFEA